MKKIFLVIFVMLVIVAFTAPAFAVKSICDTGCDWVSTSFGGGEFKPSTKVTISTVADGVNYCAATQHSGAAGNNAAGKQFGTISSSPAIKSANPATTPGPTPCTAANALPAGTWN